MLRTQSPRAGPLRVLADGEHVAIGIAEPRHFRAAGRVPDAERILLQTGIALERNAAGGELPGKAVGVGNLPAEHREFLRLEVRDDRRAQADTADLEDEREVVFIKQVETELVAVESAGRVGVADRHEGYKFLIRKHGMSPDGSQYRPGIGTVE